MTLGMYSCAFLQKCTPTHTALYCLCSRKLSFTVLRQAFFIWSLVLCLQIEHSAKRIWNELSDIWTISILAHRGFFRWQWPSFSHTLYHCSPDFALFSSLFAAQFHSFLPGALGKLKQTRSPLGSWQNNGPSHHIISFVWVSVNGMHLLISRPLKLSATGEVGGLALMTTFNDPDEPIDRKQINK